jgi:hypothetical protein
MGGKGRMGRTRYFRLVEISDLKEPGAKNHDSNPGRLTGMKGGFGFSHHFFVAHLRLSAYSQKCDEGQG